MLRGMMFCQNQPCGLFGTVTGLLIAAVWGCTDSETDPVTSQGGLNAATGGSSAATSTHAAASASASPSPSVQVSSGPAASMFAAPTASSVASAIATASSSSSVGSPVASAVSSIPTTALSASAAPSSPSPVGSASASASSSTAPAPACPAATPLTGGKEYCSNSTGNSGKYSYELWAEGSGTGCMTVYGKDAAFSAKWNGVEDLLARVGLQFDRNKTHTQIGTLSAEFAETKTGDTGLVYIGIYGWTVDPLREYYILDDWGAIKPAGTASDGTPRTHVGTINVDGDTYEVWKKTRMNKPAITGPSETFDQYFSIRQNARQCGHISISEHFSKWEQLGLQLGKLTEAKVLVEAQDSTGTIEFTTATVTAK
jgi:endo-1,4-beta-xylanase